MRHPDWIRHTLSRRQDWSEGLATFHLEGEVPEFKSGQFLRVGLDIGEDKPLSRPYSVASAPDGHLEFFIVLVEGGASVAGALQRRYARFGDWTLDCAANTLRGQDDGEQVLGTAEAQVLRTFLERPNQILTREQLMGTRDLSPMDRSIDVRISRLRRRLESDPHNPRMIKTVYGAGYMFCAVVSWS